MEKGLDRINRIYRIEANVQALYRTTANMRFPGFNPVNPVQKISSPTPLQLRIYENRSGRVLYRNSDRSNSNWKCVELMKSVSILVMPFIALRIILKSSEAAPRQEKSAKLSETRNED